MRNLKKVLSLALALVMLLGMMVVGAGAADFKDASSIKNTEAVDVVSGIKVLEGTGDGNFNPTGTLTRAEAAVVIAKLDLGEAFGNLATTNASTFTDVPANHWAKAYIDYCTARGLIVGSTGKFMPNDKVSGVQFGLMVARVLGYEDGNEDLGGAAWEVKAAALARKAGLTKDVTIGSEAMTRDDMAQVAFNALTAEMVEYSSSGITIGNVVIPAGKAKPVMHKTGDELYNDAGTVGSSQSISVKLCEEKFANLELDASGGETDDFGRPANVWTYKGSEIASTDAATAVVTYKTQRTGAQITKDLKGAGAKVPDADVGSLTNGYCADTDDVYDKGTTSATLNAIADNIATLTGTGKKVEVYLNSDSEIDKVIVTAYTVGKVSAVTAGSNTDGSYTMYRVGSVSGRVYEDKTVGDTVVVNGDVAKDDVVTYVMTKDGNNANNVLYIYPTTTVEGTQTSYSTNPAENGKNVRTIIVDGEKLVVSEQISGVTAADFVNGSEAGSYSVDVNGFVVAVDVPDAAEGDYVVLDKIALTSGLASSCQAIIVDLEGTSSTVTVTKLVLEDGSTKALSSVNGRAENNTALCGIIYKASVDSKGNYTLTADKSFTKSATVGNNTSAVQITKKGSPVVTTGATTAAGSITANSKTVFIVKSTAGSGYKYTAYAGYAEVPSITTGTTANDKVGLDYAGKTTGADVVFIDTTIENSSITVAGDSASGDMIYVYKANDYQINGTGASATRTYNSVVVNGEQTTVTTANTTAMDALNTVGLYMATTKDGDTVTGVVAQSAGNTATDAYKKIVGESKFSNAGRNVIILDGVSYTYKGDETVYFIGVDGAVSEGTPDDVKAKTDAASIKAIYVKEKSGSATNEVDKMYVVAADATSTFYTIIAKTDADGFGSDALNAVAFTNFTAKTTDDRVCAGDAIAVPVKSDAKTATRGGTYKLNVNGSVVATQTVGAGGTVADFTFTMPAENVATMTVTWEEAEYAITKVVTGGSSDVLNGLTITVTDGADPITKAGGTDTVTVKLTGTATAAGDYTITVTKPDGTAFDPGVTVTTSPVTVTASEDCTDSKAKTAMFTMPDAAVKVTITFTATI